MKKFRIILPAILLLISVCKIEAQSVPSVEITPDARAAGMAGASIAMDPTGFSIYSNTAGIVFSEENTAISYGFTNWFGDNYLHVASGYYKLNDRHAIGLGLRYYDGEKIENANYTKVNPFDLILDLAYAYRICDYMSASANVRYVNSRINKGEGIDRGEAFAFDLGFQFRKDNYSAALTLANLGTKVDYGFAKESMPASLNLGGAYKYEFLPKHQITGSLEGNYRFMPSGTTYIGGGIGAEYMYNNFVAVRGGYHLADKKKSPGNYGSLGCGVYLGPVLIDFSYLLTEHDSILRDVWRVSLGVKF